jgi:hypothetical protein
MKRDDGEVVWDGSHRGVDADLLTSEPIAQKRRAAIDHVVPGRNVKAEVFALLARAGREPWTMAEITAEINATLHSVNGALYTLIQEGLVMRADATAPRLRSGNVTAGKVNRYQAIARTASPAAGARGRAGQITAATGSQEEF